MQISDKQLHKSKVFRQSLDQIWDRWTSHDGLKSFFGKDNHISLRPNGPFEIYFLMENAVGSRGSEGCKVLSYLPKRLLSFTWNVPPQFEAQRASEHFTWVIIEFRVIDQERTELVLTHIGWPEEPIWLEIYDYFDKAWDEVFESLSKKDTPINTTTKVAKKVTGIGGIFFKCKDPKAVKAWYHTHLGLETDDYGAGFEWRQGSDATKYGFTQWSPFAENTTYFEPSSREFMINYRVEDLEALVAALKASGVTITDEIETYDYGKFVHIMDLEGNKIELWQANDEEYDKIVEARNK